MAATVHISASRELVARRPAVRAKIAHLEERLNRLSDEELEAVLNGISRALKPPEAEGTPSAAALLGEEISEAQRVEEEVEILMRSFERRRELLADTLTAPQVARLLNTTRQTPHDRVRAGTLLAVMDRGALRFPRWQFDPEGPDGVVPGLPDVIRALDVTPLAKVSWLTRPNPMLDGRTPLECLRAGQVERIARLARSVGAD